MDLMASMSLAANRPLNWNVLGVNPQHPEGHQQQLSASDYAADRGARVVALTVPDLMRFRLSLLTGFIFDALPGWGETMALPPAEKMKVLADPDERRRLNEGANSPEAGVLRGMASWTHLTIAETFAPENEGATGAHGRRGRGRAGPGPVRHGVRHRGCRRAAHRMVAPHGQRRRRELEDAPRGVARPARRARCIRCRRPSRHDRLLHLHNRTARSIGARSSAAPARGGRPSPHRRSPPGSTACGVAGASSTVGRPISSCSTRSGSGRRPVHTRYDLPAGAGRLYGEADGVEHVLVNGVEIAAGGEFTGDRPGTLLRSGRDTDTVEVPGGAGRG